MRLSAYCRKQLPGSLARSQLAEVAQGLLQKNSEQRFVLRKTVCHHHHGVVIANPALCRQIASGSIHQAGGIGKAVQRRQVRSAVPNRDVPAEKAGKFHQRLGIIARSQDNKTLARRQRLKKIFGAIRLQIRRTVLSRGRLKQLVKSRVFRWIGERIEPMFSYLGPPSEVARAA